MQLSAEQYHRVRAFHDMYLQVFMAPTMKVRSGRPLILVIHSRSDPGGKGRFYIAFPCV